MPRLVRSSRRRSWWLLLAFVALLVLSGCNDTSASNAPQSGGGATATPAPTPTAVHIDGWQTYSDKAYAFTIQYPPQWTALLEPQPQGTPY